MVFTPPKTPKIFGSGNGVFELFRGGERGGEKSEKIVRERGRGTGNGVGVKLYLKHLSRDLSLYKTVLDLVKGGT